MRRELKIPPGVSPGAVIGRHGVHMKEIVVKYVVQCWVDSSRRVLVISGHDRRVQDAAEAAALLLRRLVLRVPQTGVQKLIFTVVHNGAASIWRFRELAPATALPTKYLRYELMKAGTLPQDCDASEDYGHWDCDDNRTPLFHWTNEYLERVMAPSITSFCARSGGESASNSRMTVTALLGTKLFSSNAVVSELTYTWEELQAAHLTHVNGFSSQWYRHCTDNTTPLLKRVWTRVFQEVASKSAPQIALLVSVITTPSVVLTVPTRTDHVFTFDGREWRETIMRMPSLLFHDVLVDGSAGIRVRCGMAVDVPQVTHYQVRVVSPPSGEWRRINAQVVTITRSMDVTVIHKRVSETWRGQWHGLDITLRRSVSGETRIDCVLPAIEERDMSTEAIASTLTKRVLALIATCDEVPATLQDRCQDARNNVDDVKTLLTKDGQVVESWEELCP